ncbi:MAG: site-2 protease family protein [Candidatus Limnocylindria bacterium]
MDDRLVASIIVVGIMLLIGFPVHEFAHALAAYRLGDGTAKLFGRLTLNPVAHFDPLGGLLLAVSFIGAGFGFGWAKPTPVNPNNLEGGRFGEAIVAAAGPVSNLILAVIVALPLRYILADPDLFASVPDLVLTIMSLFVFINLVLMLFNLLPIPPLDGSKVLFAFLSPRQTYRWRPLLEQYGFILILILFFFPPGGSIGSRIIGPILDGLFGLLVGR